MRAWVRRLRRLPALARDALAFLCLGLAFLLGAGLPVVPLSLSTLLLAAAIVLLALGLGVESALFGALLLVAVLRLGRGQVEIAWLHLAEVAGVIVAATVAVQLLRKLRRYRRAALVAHRQADDSVRAAAALVQQLRGELREADRRQPSGPGARSQPARPQGDPLDAAFRNEGGV